MAGEVETSKSYACFASKEELKEWTFELHTLGDDDVEIKVAYSGICHSDIHTILGEWGDQNWPIVPGHEIVGYITKVGKNVTTLHLGQRVGVGAQALSCLKCDQCHQQKENYCLKEFIGTYGAMLDDGYITKGGYAHYHRAHSHWVFPIPDALSSAEAAPLLCAGATVWEPLKLANVKPGSKVGIVGIGGLGHIGIQFAAALGAEVVAISSSDSKKEEAAKLGAKQFINHQKRTDMVAHNQSFDMILNTVSAPLDYEAIFRLMKPHGIVSNVGLPEKPISIPSSCFGKHILLTGTTVASPSEITEMLVFSAKHDVKAVIEIYPFNKVNEAIAKVLKNEARYRIVLAVDESLDEQHKAKKSK